MHMGEAFGNHKLQINKRVAPIDSVGFLWDLSLISDFRPVVPSLSSLLAMREARIWADAQISNSSLPSSGQYIGQSTNWATVWRNNLFL